MSPTNQRNLLYSIILPICLLLSHVSSQKVIPLSGSDWTVSNPSLNVSVQGNLPSQAHLDLYAADVIGDPYHDLNDFNLRWVAWANWTYTSDPISGLLPSSSTPSSNTTLSRRRQIRFNGNNSTGNGTASSTWLLFDGLDTFTSISFCSKHVASTNNQFRQYWFDVSDLLQGCAPEDRVLKIEFGSAPTIANQIAAEPGQETWPSGVQQVYEFENRWFIRKEQSDFGWDWGPAFAPAGPWRPAWIVQLSDQEMYVRNSIVDIYRKGQINNLPPDQTQPWIVNASIDYFGATLSSNSNSILKFTYELTDASGKQVASGSFDDVNVTASTVTGMTTIDDGVVDLWWPAQLGAQNMYNMTISLASSAGTELASLTKRVGFRTIVLNELPISKAQLAMGIAPGNNWHFEVNGHEFYAKGSNFIPPDAFWPRVTEEKMDQLFDSVIAGNQNMLRVWASGAYSPDFIYDLADEKGILLWSEFEFGDALYPVDQPFLDNVREEVLYQVRRVNHHPSLALWAGGNELESLELVSVNSSAPEQLPKYMAQYETLFIDTIATAVFQNSRSISYEPSSTQNGWTKLNVTSPHPLIERYFNLTPGSIYGDTDFYNYDPAVLYDDSAYPVGRFSNEFGFHSMPSVQSWASQISADQLHFNSTVVMLRNHHYPPGGLNTSNFANTSQGMAEMTQAVQEWYPVPNKTDSIGNFSSWCWATQVFQADLYKSEIQFYRRGSGLPERQLGSLYWQLNDIWVAPTWASVEYDGRWKILHYFAQDIYKQVIIAPYYNITTGNLSVWVTSDLWESVQGQATLEWFDWSGNALTVGSNSSAMNNSTSSGSMSFSVGALNSTQILQTFTNTLLSNQAPSNAVMRMSISTSGHLPNNDTEQTFTHENWFSPVALKDAKLVDPGLTLSHSNDTKQFTLTATTGVAAWVWLDYPAGAVLNFESNGFWLMKGEERNVGYTVKSDSTDGGWVDGVTVMSLWNQTLSE